MKLDTVLERIPLWYRAAITSPTAAKCVNIRSSPGRGKTTTFVNAAALLSKELGKNIGYVIINGPLLNPQDSIGYLIPKIIEPTIEWPAGRAESLYTEPFWFRTKEGKRLDEYDGGIIVVDEADKMDVDVKKVIGEAALSAQLGPHKLPPGWVVWMAGNHQGDRSGSTKELDHLINRRRDIDITDDIDSLIHWMDGNGAAPVTKAFAHQHPEIVFMEKPEKQGPWCTPRSLMAVDGYLQVVLGANGKLDPEDYSLVEEMTGEISAPAAMAYLAFVKLELEMPKFETIVANPDKVRVPERADAQYLVCFGLAHRISASTAKAVVTYVERMPKEFAVTFATAACKRDFRLVTTPAFQDWVMRNASLMQVLNKYGR